MSLLSEYLYYIYEQNKDITLYHGSSKQGLKVIEPKRSESDDIKYSPRVWASERKQFAAVFSLPWRLMYLKGVNCKSKKITDMMDCETWDIEINRRNIWDFHQPCSIYYVKASNWFRPKISAFKSIFSDKYRANALPEHYTFGKVRVIKEEKYKTVKECYKKNKIKFHYEGVSSNYKAPKIKPMVWF